MDWLLEFIEENGRPITYVIIMIGGYFLFTLGGETFTKQDLKYYVISWLIIYFVMALNDIAFNAIKSKQLLEQIQKDIANMKG